MANIVEYRLRPDETMADALRFSGVSHTDKEVVEGKPNKDIMYSDPVYLINGCWEGCVCGGNQGHASWCPGCKVKEFINFIFPTCPVCVGGRLWNSQQVCDGCEKYGESCSCYTPTTDWHCKQEDKHDKAYYAKRRGQWKARLASLGIQTD